MPTTTDRPPATPPETLPPGERRDDWNQPPPLAGYNAFEQDRALGEALAREGGDWLEDEARSLGAVAGSAEALRWGELAHRHPPELRTHDRFGERIDRVDFHPAWHRLMELGVARRTHSLPWSDPRPGAHTGRAALMFLRHQIEEGTSCPLTMTFAVVPSLRLEPELAAEWEPRVLSTEYDRRFVPAADKRGALFGMAMTERQGGSDVRANRTRAEPVGGEGGGPGGEYRLTGHKWFCSAPMCDAFLVLAQAPGGLTCFLMPRFAPDGTLNPMRINRLKDKLGNRANASSEIELDGVWARRVGEEGRGVATILEMVRHTRLDCVIGAAATMRRAIAEATHHAHHRRAFGRPLDEQPLMRNVLADLCLESEAATAMALRLARAFDDAAGDEGQSDEGRVRLMRLLTPVAKYHVTRRAVAAVAEALECIGGNGYVEEHPIARLYREAPLNSLWEGAGNIQCLDVLRAAGKDPAVLEALLGELRAARGGDRRYDAFLDRFERDLAGGGDGIDPVVSDPGAARRLTERAALACEASLLVRAAPPFVADAFCASRLGGDGGQALGTLPAGLDLGRIVDRARPRLAGS